MDLIKVCFFVILWAFLPLSGWGGYLFAQNVPGSKKDTSVKKNAPAPKLPQNAGKKPVAVDTTKKKPPLSKQDSLKTPKPNVAKQDTPLKKAPDTKKKKKKKQSSTQKKPTTTQKPNNQTAVPKVPPKEKPKHISPLGDDAPVPKDYKPQFNDINQKDSEVLVSLFNQQSGSFRQMIKNPKKHKIQIIYTQVRRQSDNRPQLRHHTYSLDSLEHFFPASMVKLPTCAMALEKINTLKMPGFTAHTHMIVRDGRFPCLKGNSKLEASKRLGHPSISHYIKDVLVASGNIAYDRLYEFMGQRELNDRLHDKGYRSFVITQRYGAPCSVDENRYTQAMTFIKGDTTVYRQAEAVSRTEYRYKVKNNNTGEVSDKGLHYTYRNFGTLKDLHEVLIAIMMPMTVPKAKRFKLTKEDYRLLHKYMSMLPTESKDPVFDPSWFIPTRMKYLYYGSNEKKPKPNIRIFNKVGLAHGFLIDCAYFVDFEAGIEFFLSAVICTKDNPNDQNPEYFKDGMPFMKKLGEIIYDYEKTRKLKYRPDLSFYLHDYTTY